jgi:hypothetical protein
MAKTVKTGTPLPANFVRLSLSEPATASALGPLADLVGTWVGNKGWNLVSVPQGPNFKLLIRPYYETITIYPAGAPVPNRGGVVEQFVGTLVYDLRINDMITNETLHLENGMWLWLGNIGPQPGGGSSMVKPLPVEFSVARQASIPHGDTIIALGNAVPSKGAPAIPPVSPMPIGTPVGAMPGYFDPFMVPPTDFPEFTTSNPNQMLVDVLKTQKIGKVTTFTVDTSNAGGNISNIPFIKQHANAASCKATFWIADVLNPDGTSFKQMQYSQTVMIDFLKNGNPKIKNSLVRWPHISVNTLVKQ